MKIMDLLKIALAFSLILSWFSIGYLLVFGKIIDTGSPTAASPTTTLLVTTSKESASIKSKTFTLPEITLHNSSRDCYLLVNNKVYDVTSFLSIHPGGGSLITPYCGKEATKAFQTQGGEGRHSAAATAMIQDYYVGDLKM